MRRAKGLTELSRRDFCGLACAGVALAGCSNGLGAIQTGPLGAGDDGVTPDAPNGNPNPDAGIGPDAHAGGADASMSGVACTATTTDVGAASTYLMNKPVLHGSFFVVRDANGLFAVSAKCTHEGALMQVSGSDYYCPRHGAQFTFDGTIVSGPVSTGLVHYAMCNLANGNIGVETSLTVAKSQRLVA